MIPTFTDPSLLEEALTHTSWAYENGGTHNERLEFWATLFSNSSVRSSYFSAFQVNERERSTAIGPAS